MGTNEKLLTLINKISSKDVTVNDTNWTNMLEFSPTKKVFIKPQNYAALWRGYCELAADEESYLCLSEKPVDIMPVMISMKFCFARDSVSSDNFELVHEESFVATLVMLAQQVIMDIINVSADERELTCCVLESANSWIDVDVEDGKHLCNRLRLQFPYCRVENIVLSQVFYSKFISLCRSENVFSLLPAQPSSDWNEIIDLHYYQKPVLLVGSQYSNLEPPLKFNYLYERLDADMVAAENYERLSANDVFGFARHGHVANGYISMEMFENEDPDEWIPFFLSVHYGTGISTVKELSQEKTKIKLKVASKNSNNYSEAEMARTFLPLISDNRKAQKCYWYDIGKALYNVFDGSDEGLELWCELTSNIDSQDDGVDEDMCDTEYYNFSSNNNLTIKTLAWYAKADSPDAYEKWHEEWVQDVLLKSTNGWDAKVADALYRCHWLDFAFAPVGTGIWYKYIKNRWVKDNMGSRVKRIISNELANKYERLRVKLANEVASTTDDSTKLRLEAIIKDIGRLIAKLNKNGSKTSIFREAKEIFEIEDFTSYLDQNQYCVAHINGITEVVDDKIVFRPGKPEDFISKSTMVKWDSNLNWHHPLVNQVMEWFAKVFVDEELRETFCKYGGSWFYGGNPDKLIPCFTGEGDNGKSIVVKAFEAAWGQYCFKVPNSLFTTVQKNSGAANPEMAQANGSRGGFSDELEEDEVLRTGLLKKLSGGDSFFARFLHDNGGKVKVTFKLILVCNKIPRMNSVHQSVKSRFLIIPFDSFFTDEAPEDPIMQVKLKRFKKDPFFENQIPKMAPAILWVFSKYFTKYKQEGLKTPKAVIDACNNYWKDVDIYEMFKSEYIVEAWKDKTAKVRDTDARVTVKEMHREFKVWFKGQYENEKVPTIRDFKLEMIKKLNNQKPAEDRYWPGIILTTQQAANVDGNTNSANNNANELKKALIKI